MKLNLENTSCRNCGAEMPTQSLYCPKCSQKNTDGRIPVLAFVQDLFENIFNIDSKLFRTALGLFIPGKLTKEFFKGKHKSFATPSRLFLMSAILFFAMISFSVQKSIEDDNIKADIFGIDDDLKNSEEIISGIEQIKSNIQDKLPEEVEEQLDSLTQIAKEDSLSIRKIDVTLLGERTYMIEPLDFKNLSADSMIRKYKIVNFYDKILFKQAHKLYNNPRSMIFALIGNLTWMMLLLIPSMALILKVLYVRRRKYYVEHLVYLFHLHAFFMLFGFVWLAVKYFIEFEIPGMAAFGISMLFLLYILFSLKRVYEQSWIKTILKLLMILVSYGVILIVCLVFISIVSFLLF